MRLFVDVIVVAVFLRLFMIFTIYMLSWVFCRYKAGRRSNVGVAPTNGQRIHASAMHISLGNWLNGLVRYGLIRAGCIPSHFIRKWLYRNIFQVTFSGGNIVIHGRCEIRDPWNLRIGSGSIIGDSCILDARYGITIGENVNLFSGVWVWTAQHDPNSPTFSCESSCGPVAIGDRAWISSRTTILPDVRIGEASVIAAGAVMVKSAEPYTIYGGIPAKQIGNRSRDLTYEFNGSRIPFF
jgi:acetyltransferase-like isoleucine patch superfamily enzyme